MKFQIILFLSTYFSISNSKNLISFDDDFVLRIQTRRIFDSTSTTTAKRKVFIHSSNNQYPIDYYANRGSKIVEKNENGAHGRIAVKFQSPDDGKQVVEIFDFDKNLRSTRIILLGEIARGERAFTELCFVDDLDRTSLQLLSPDSIMKLRQRNSMNVHFAEDDRGSETRLFDFFIPRNRISGRSPSIDSVMADLCSNAGGLYATEKVMEKLVGGDGIASMEFAIRKNSTDVRKCSRDGEGESGGWCECSVGYCLPWYPCGWKYCDKDGSPLTNSTILGNSTDAIRCGVRSCRTRRIFTFPITNGGRADAGQMCESDEGC